MSSFVKDDKRRLVPRWRSSRTTIANGELDPVELESRESNHPDPRNFDEKRRDWVENRSPVFASDLVAAGVVLNRETEVRDAAQYVLEHSSEVSRPAIHLATRVMNPDQASVEDTVESENPLLSVDGAESLRTHPVRNLIASLRRRLVEYPRNPIAWVDLARYYTIVGEEQHAKKAINSAVSLAPNSRFVLRSASRFWVHASDAERGHAVLRRSPRTRTDPWLLSAEIAVADVAGKVSRLVKDGRAMLEGEIFAPSQLTELAGSIASLELDAGKVRKARKLFLAALEEPNDNTIAQAEWASRRTPEIHVEAHLLKTPMSFEARAWESFVNRNWKDALTESWAWFRDEPFSQRPVALGTHIASVALEDYDAAEKLARTWLSANPNDQVVLNNLAFALASGGRVETARQVLRSRNLEIAETSTQITWTATEGLIRFREGDVQGGRALYERAVSMARQHNMSALESLAMAFWAREEILAKTPEALTYFERFNAVPETATVNSLSIELLRGKLRRLLRDLSTT